MLILVLRIIGWLGVVTGSLNIGVALFGSDEDVAILLGSSRNLDVSIYVIAVCLVFLVLAGILKRLDQIVENTSINTKDEN